MRSFPPGHYIAREAIARGGSNRGLRGQRSLDAEELWPLLDSEAAFDRFPDPARISVASDGLRHEGASPGGTPVLIDRDCSELAEGVVRHRMAIVLAFQGVG